MFTLILRLTFLRTNGLRIFNALFSIDVHTDIFKLESEDQSLFPGHYLLIGNSQLVVNYWEIYLNKNFENKQTNNNLKGLFRFKEAFKGPEEFKGGSIKKGGSP